MSVLAELLAVVVVWLSAMALSHLGIDIKAETQISTSSERTVLRTPREGRQAPSPVVPDDARVQ